MDARRKHVVLKQRCLALATKVQILRNRGYAMGGDEEDLKTKLQALERGVTDPALSARGEEIWARMLTVQERAKLLKAEIEKSGSDDPVGLDEAMDQQAKKVCNLLPEVRVLLTLLDP
jgi:nuclear pore complex protein Nup54